MNKYYLGVDLGSTTSKAVIINDRDEIIGRGITNTRANYRVAVDIARLESIYNARFFLIKKLLNEEIKINPIYQRYLDDIEKAFQYLQFKKRLSSLLSQLKLTVESRFSDFIRDKIYTNIENIIEKIDTLIKDEYLSGNLGSKNQFFRDIVNEKYHDEVTALDIDMFEPLMLAFDKSITPVENEMVEFDFRELVYDAMSILEDKYNGLANRTYNDVSVHFDAELNLLKGSYGKITDTFKEHLDRVAGQDFHISNMVGTGYGRALLPFPEECIKSEILCHAFGAHAIFPGTRTVLDIGGQDTKAIQVDSHGLVTSFYMNDRCAAGCGRYLGYIADELNISLNELGSTALSATKETNICSTCTVFAGAELREQLNVGEKREDILAGLHKAIVMRAMSLIARSGGVRNEFTFTGGVARNKAVLKYVTELVKKNYGDDLKINIHTDSIFMGALGGAMFARRNVNIN
ncbi:MAG: benzoyl-CoA reductase subunit A [Ignavibacteriae bacterium]|nr:MAG: benzoyl-CoA reductase subunit A [Ignavibacteriota bacterium]